MALNAQALALSEGYGEKAAAEFYAAGLFHDIGRIVIADNLSQAYATLMRQRQENKAPLIQLEKDAFGATHAEAGAYLMALWGFSDNVVNACAFHHLPVNFSQPGFSPVTAVHLGDVFDHEQMPNRKSVEPLDLDYIKREAFERKVDIWRGVMQRRMRQK